ncbi:sigma-70 family RNA polymerase sigma factor [Clostridium sp.]|uniref:sigma-70 family RNA polymerase sigma factor n=1 Tax=Clostridium sp. TaxID=1506 RepID=UPI002846802A|nr:sigma-70 family RNA polymerase sigma factor [Clostridium sp.]MDR3596294.1 sigma-70 family RNA polymerase sigma factor [Clostridium sp.]
MSEEELVKGLIAKDVDIFNEFINMYSLDILKGIAYVLREPQDKDCIEECFDDVVMQVLEKSNTFKFECPFRGWVMCIAKNKALDYKRKIKKYYKEIELDDNISENTCIEDEYIRKESVNEFDKIVDKLDISDKTLFIKKYVLENSTKELCDYYFISENVLYKRLSRLRKKIKNLFENMKSGEENIYE